MARVTVELLQEHGAGTDQIEIFRSFLKDRAYILPTVRNLGLIGKTDFKVPWAIRKGLFSRKSTLRSPRYALCYAQDVDGGPRDDTRQAVLDDPACAYQYAMYVDRGPRDDTRAASLADPMYAFLYAANVDRCRRKDTLQAVNKSPYYVMYFTDIPERRR